VIMLTINIELISFFETVFFSTDIVNWAMKIKIV
jgi:hypothetical protein